MYLISFYVPDTHVESVKQALFNKGAGKFNRYDACSWQTPGRGEFRPLKGSRPFFGQQNKTCKLDEYKVEMVCREEFIIDVLETLVNVHPYEEPAYHVIKIMTLNDLKQ